MEQNVIIAKSLKSVELYALKKKIMRKVYFAPDFKPVFGKNLFSYGRFGRSVFLLFPAGYL